MEFSLSIACTKFRDSIEVWNCFKIDFSANEVVSRSLALCLPVILVVVGDLFIVEDC